MFKKKEQQKKNKHVNDKELLETEKRRIYIYIFYKTVTKKRK